jgi:DNA-binding NarL/FixJ family response regulator
MTESAIPPAPAVPRRTRILLVDDHPMTREGMAHLVSGDPELEVVGGAANASEALQLVQRLEPDLLIIDISLPGRNGIELIKDLLAWRSTLIILVCSMHDELLYAERALKAGARGFIMKQEGGEVLREAIQRVRNQDIYLSRRMATRLALNYSHLRTRGATNAVELLSDRELEVFQHIGRGKRTQEIAELLHLSPKTVETHRSHIKTKLNLPDANALVHFATRWIDSTS